jgi:hypothetical protein
MAFPRANRAFRALVKPSPFGRCDAIEACSPDLASPCVRPAGLPAPAQVRFPGAGTGMAVAEDRRVESGRVARMATCVAQPATGQNVAVPSPCPTSNPGPALDRSFGLVTRSLPRPAVGSSPLANSADFGGFLGHLTIRAPARRVLAHRRCGVPRALKRGDGGRAESARAVDDCSVVAAEGPCQRLRPRALPIDPTRLRAHTRRRSCPHRLA